MSTSIEFEWDSRTLSVFRGGKVESAIARSLRLAGNQAIRSLRKDATAFAAARKALPGVVITEDQRLSLPNRAAAIRDFAWTLFVKGKPVPVSAFRHSDTRRAGRGVRARGVLVSIDQGRVTSIRSAFVATMKTGHKGVFRRTGKKRLPIEEVFSSRLPARFGGEVMLTYGGKTYRKLATAYARGLDRELGKLKRKGNL